MRQIATEADWQHLLNEGRGFIYNDFSGIGAGGTQNNILHAAACRTLTTANMNVNKYFAVDLAEAERWLQVNRGDNWKRCGTCMP